MAVSTDLSILASVAFSSGAIVAYAVAKWRESTLGDLREARLKNEIELARRAASVEAAEIQAQAHDANREAHRLLAAAKVEVAALQELKSANERQREFLQQELLRLSGIKPEEAKQKVLEFLQKNYETEARTLRHEKLDQAEQEVADEARRILLSTRQPLFQ